MEYLIFFNSEAKSSRDFLQIIIMSDDKKTQKPIGRFDLSISSLKKRTSFDKWYDTVIVKK
jgi:hypothetical protein